MTKNAEEDTRKFFIDYVRLRRNGSCAILTSHAIQEYRSKVRHSPLSDDEIIDIFAEVAITFHFPIYFDGTRKN